MHFGVLAHLTRVPRAAASSDCGAPSRRPGRRWTQLNRFSHIAAQRLIHDYPGVRPEWALTAFCRPHNREGLRVRYRG